MARITKPKKATRKGAPPAAHAAAPKTNLDRKSAGGELAALNFKVPPGFKREFKGHATAEGVSMVELLMASYKTHRAANG